jgi:hypothetical protein
MSLMALSNIAVVTTEPDGTKPIFKFFSSKEVARDHAQRICKDLARDAYILELKEKFIADRSKIYLNPARKLRHPPEPDI